MVLTGINWQKWVGVSKYQPAAMVVWCFCSTRGERERGWVQAGGECEGMREGWMMELTQPCSWLGCSINDLLSSWFLSQWSPSSHALYFSCSGTCWTSPWIDLYCWRKRKLPQQTNSEIPAVFARWMAYLVHRGARLTQSRRWRACRTIRERERGWKAAHFDTRCC